MKRLEGFAFVWLVAVATFLAVPSYRAINNIARDAWNEDARLAETHDRLNQGVVKVGDAVEKAGGSVSNVETTLTDPKTGAIPRIVFSFTDKDSGLQAHMASIDRAVNAAILGDQDRSGLLDTTSSITRLSDQYAKVGRQVYDTIPLLQTQFSSLLDGSKSTLYAWQKTGDVAAQHLPLLLKDFDKVVRISGFIGKDIHTWTFRATKPQSTHSKIWSLGLDLGKACLRFC